MSKHKTKLLKEYMESLDKEGSGADYNDLFDKEEFYKYRESYNVEDSTYRDVYAGVMLDIMKGELNKEDFDIAMPERLRVAQDKRCRRAQKQEQGSNQNKDVDLNIISHPVLTRMLSGSKIDWFDMEVVSAISLAIKEKMQGDYKDYLINVERVHELIYGKGFSRQSYKMEFTKKLVQSVRNIRKQSGCFIYEERQLNTSFVLDGVFDNTGVGEFRASDLMYDAFNHRNLIVIPHKFLNERECKTQDMKNYILYRYLWKKDNPHCIRLVTMQEQLGFSVDGKVLKRVLDSLAKEGIVITKKVNVSTGESILKY